MDGDDGSVITGKHLTTLVMAKTINSMLDGFSHS